MEARRAGRSLALRAPPLLYQTKLHYKFSQQARRRGRSLPLKVLQL